MTANWDCIAISRLGCTSPSMTAQGTWVEVKTMTKANSTETEVAAVREKSRLDVRQRKSGGHRRLLLKYFSALACLSLIGGTGFYARTQATTPSPDPIQAGVRRVAELNFKRIDELGISDGQPGILSVCSNGSQGSVTATIGFGTTNLGLVGSTKPGGTSLLCYRIPTSFKGIIKVSVSLGGIAHALSVLVA